MLNACVVVGKQQASDEDIARANVNLATEYFRQGRFEFALDNVKKALKADPESVEANSLSGLIYNEIGEPDLAQEYFEVAVEHVRSDSSEYGKVHNNYGVFLCKNKQMLDAEEHFLLAAENKLYKTPELAYKNAGLCALDQAKNKKARLFFNKALKLNSNMSGVILELAALELMQKNYDAAQSYSKRYAKVGVQSAKSLWLGIQIYRGMGDANKAQKLLAQLKREFPESNEFQQLSQGAMVLSQ